MKIRIVGAGNVGAAIGSAWLAKGHDVRWGVPNPDDPKYQKLDRARLSLPAEVVHDADVIVMATPWAATQEAIAGLGNLSGAVLIDATNPLRMGAGGLELALGHHTSGGEMVAEWAAGADVFKTLNQTGAENMGDASRYSPPPLMMVAGSDSPAKEIVMGLVGDLGFQAVDAGLITAARLLEPLALLWIEQAMKFRRGREFVLTLAHA